MSAEISDFFSNDAARSVYLINARPTSSATETGEEQRFWELLQKAQALELNGLFTDAEEIYLGAVRFGLRFLADSITANAAFQLSAMYLRRDRLETAKFWWRRTCELMKWPVSEV